MSTKSPLIDKRTFDDTLTELQSRVPGYTPEWKAAEQDAGSGLLKIFAHMIEDIKKRLNRVPDNHFLAFLDMIGVKRIPPVAARVPVTFKLAGGTTEHITAHAATQVVSNDIVYETEETIALSPAQLVKHYIAFPADDRLCEKKTDLQEHVLYLGHKTFFESKEPFSFRVSRDFISFFQVTWEYYGEKITYDEEGVENTDIGWHPLKFKENGSVITHDGKLVITKEHPGEIQQHEINGVKSRWIRCVAESIETDKPVERVVFTHSTYETCPKAKPEITLTMNNLAWTDHSAVLNREAFVPFVQVPAEHDTLYLGFDKKLSKGPLNILFHFNDDDRDPSEKDIHELEWFYTGTGGERKSPAVIDQTMHFGKTGIVRFYMPDDFMRTPLFGRDIYWIEVEDRNSNLEKLPDITGIYLNTVYAVQSEAVTGEIIGSSDKSINQQFKTARAPLISAELRVNEIMSLNEHSSDELIGRYGEDAVEVTTDVNGKIKEIWVKWTDVNDFYDSLPDSRHYVLDRITGDVYFGDGIKGMVPPIGTSNIRMNYKIGGGTKGNIKAHEITGQRTSIPYVEKVTNYLPAGGGADTELLDEVKKRGPHLIKHRNRAVTLEDFERIAKEVSANIVRSKCLIDKGNVTVIIIPHDKGDKPVPNLVLCDTVKKYLLSCRHAVIPADAIVVAKPEYKDVNVYVELVPTSIDDAVGLEAVISRKLKEFFHPLYGGYTGTGWEFGRNIYLSDVYSFIEGIAEVDHIKTLLLNDEDADILVTHTQTVCSGNHKIKLVFGE